MWARTFNGKAVPKKAKELTALAVSKLKQPGRYAVGGADGLHIRISPTGFRSWLLRVNAGSKRRDIGLGSYPEVSLSEARDAARDYRKQIQSGIDPQNQKQRAKSSLIALQAASKSFEECAEAYIYAKSSEWKNPKHHQQWENTLKQYAYPLIGKVSVSEIDLPQILGVLEPIWSIKTETASRLRGRLESILNWATVRKYRSGDNPARWKGHLETILPAKSKVRKVEHHTAMAIEAMPEFINQLQRKHGISARALEFLILTAARSGEVRGAKWVEIDLANMLWTIPAIRMKAGKEHRVPLSERAVSLLRALPRHSESEYVFIAPKGGQLSDMSLTAVMRRMDLDAVPHGFRSTFRDWVGEKTNYPKEIAEAALAHTLTNKVEAAYRRGDALVKRQAMMQDWSEYLLKNNRINKGIEK